MILREKVSLDATTKGRRKEETTPQVGCLLKGTTHLFFYLFLCGDIENRSSSLHQIS